MPIGPPLHGAVCALSTLLSTGAGGTAVRMLSAVPYLLIGNGSRMTSVYGSLKMEMHQIRKVKTEQKAPLSLSFHFFPPKVHGKSYFRVEDYIPASRIEKMTLAYVQRELAKLHRMNHSLFEDEAELEFLKVTCHTPNSIYLFSLW